MPSCWWPVLEAMGARYVCYNLRAGSWCSLQKSRSRSPSLFHPFNQRLLFIFFFLLVVVNRVGCCGLYSKNEREKGFGGGGLHIQTCKQFIRFHHNSSLSIAGNPCSECSVPSMVSPASSITICYSYLLLD